MSTLCALRESRIDAYLERDLVLAGGRRISIGAAIAGGLLLIGIALRVAWCLIREGDGAAGEAFNVARAIAEGRGFADSYRIGQGPTAHLLPISPGIAGGVYRLFGVNSVAAESILTVWALGLMLGTYILLFHLFGRLGVSRWARLGALAYLCLSPVYIAQEAVDFRIWEGGLAVCLGVALISSLAAAERVERISAARIAGLAVLAAVLFLVNPIVGAAGYLCALIFACRRLTMRQFALAGLMATAAIAAFVVPWGLRNAAQLGTLVPLRSNSGLELAIGQNPHAVAGVDHAEVFRRRLAEVHPTIGNEAYGRLLAMGGEIRYAEALGRETRDWVANHPGAAVRLSLRHIRQTLAPEAWQFGNGFLPGLRSALASLSGVLGLAGLAIALIRRRPLWIYVAVMVLVPAIAMAPFQPIPRYTYLFYPWLTFCAAHLVDRLKLARYPNGEGCGGRLGAEV